MKYEVRITNVAREDLYSIYRYVANNDLRGKADHLLGNIERAMASLETMPSRGSFPPELQRWGIFDFREIFFKPYRIIYTRLKTKPFSFTLFLTAGATAKTFCSSGF